MNEKWKQACSILTFLALAIVSCIAISVVVVPKYLVENTDWPSTSTFQQFYDMEKDSIDVLFVGSSSMATDIIPQKIYDAYQVTTYNLGTTEQNLITSYYWLKEALRFQSPSVVVVDNQMMFTFYADEELNFKEPGQRKDFDYMKWSKVKREAVHDICQIDKEQSELSYYLPFVRYHDRWKELEKRDFTYETTKLYGYAPLIGETPLEDNAKTDGYTPLRDDIRIEDAKQIIDETDIDSKRHELMISYMDKIVALCEEKGIAVVMLSSVSPTETETRHVITKQYASEHGLTFLDFNVKSLYEEAGLDYGTDCYDRRHMNNLGAEKISLYLGKYLMEQYGVSPREHAAFESTKGYFEEFLETQEP